MYHRFEYLLCGVLFSVGISITIVISEYLYSNEVRREKLDNDEINTCLSLQISNRFLDISYPWVITSILEEIGLDVPDVFSSLIDMSKFTSHFDYMAYSLRTTNETEFEEVFHGIYNHSIVIHPETLSDVKWPILFVHPFQVDFLGRDIYTDPSIGLVIDTVSTNSDTIFSNINLTSLDKGGIFTAQTVVIDHFQVGVVIREYSIDGFFHDIMMLPETDLYIGLVSHENTLHIYGTQNMGDRIFHGNINSMFDIIIETRGYGNIKRGTLYITSILIGFIISILFSTVSMIVIKTRSTNNMTSLMTNFISHMSHSLRTPIQGIDGLTDILSSRYSQSSVRDIKTCNDTMLTIVDDMLEMSRINANIQTINLVRFDFRSLVIGVLKSGIYFNRCFIEENISDNLNIKLVIGENLPFFIEADRSKIIQVIRNLYSNALKFTKEGTILIEIHIMDGFLKFTITDTGVGMKSDSVRRLFLPFERSHEDTRIPGTGLGLALSKKISQFLKGDLICVKSSPGIGSVFKFTFPIIGVLSNSPEVSYTIECDEILKQHSYSEYGKRHHDTRIIQSNILKNPDRSRQSSLDSDVNEIMCNSSESGSVDSNVRKSNESIVTGIDDDSFDTVLVVDDIRLNRIILTKMIGDLGLNVETCENGKECVDRCKTKKFALILLDMSMPVMGGTRACKKLRSGGDLNENTYIVMLTANTTHRAKMQSLAAGANNFMTKPVCKSSLESILRQNGVCRFPI